MTWLNIVYFLFGFTLGVVILFCIFLIFKKNSWVDENKFLISVIAKKTDKIQVFLDCLQKICDVIEQEKKADRIKKKISGLISKALDESEKIRYDEFFCENGKDENEKDKRN